MMDYINQADTTLGSGFFMQKNKTVALSFNCYLCDDALINALNK